ncbi:MAG: PfkB family carbohydrate kinase [Planctomycetota bacterium]|nr:PfkB family carbohydrate kinase [Planctomycetota bacterium]
MQFDDVISPNESELAMLSGQAIASLAAAEAAARALLAPAGGTVVVKMAEKGALWCERRGCRHYPAFAVQAVDTTAAGDAFTAALTLGLCAGKSPEEIMRLALAAGALACTRFGAQPSLPRLAEVEEFLTSICQERS